VKCLVAAQASTQAVRLTDSDDLAQVKSLLAAQAQQIAELQLALRTLQAQMARLQAAAQ